MFSSFKDLFSGHTIQQLFPKDLVELDADSYVIVDVREKWELEIASLPGAINIPLGELQSRLNELDGGHLKIVLLCHHGGRSQRAAVALLNEGFENIANLAGGIDKWATTIDTTLRRY